jgi:beta-aspartyl-peptidase (threonine type)
MTRWRLVIHGGAGSMRAEHLDPKQEKCARGGLEAALVAGSAILEKGESALDAVEAAVRVLEEDECFNAGRGSVLTAEGCIELDAAIMDGRTLSAAAVAVDADGHVAVATSTGGLTAKRWGRVGDSPLIGAGTYADDRSAAVSATGSGEFFIRAVAAHQLAERVRCGGQSLQQALDATLVDIADLGGKGGLIAVSSDGDAAWGFTTPAMYRGMADATGRTVAIYGDEDDKR